MTEPLQISRRVLAWLAFAAALGCFSPAANAQVFCYSGGTTNIDFGIISPAAATDKSGSISFTCSANQPGTLKYCLYLPEGSRPGVAPRKMFSWSAPSDFMLYDLYAPPGYTNVIGPPPTGGGFPVYSGVMSLPGNNIPVTISIPINGRVFAGQTLPAVPFQSTLYQDGTLPWAYQASGTPPNCVTGDYTGSNSPIVQITANVDNSCAIKAANDLNFGSKTDLSVAVDNTSSITIRCPVGRSWSMALSNGTNAVGSTRRMRKGVGAAAKYVTYELYKDDKRNQRWGNNGTELLNSPGSSAALTTLIVYGRVPAQPSPGSGIYTDTVTITLTY
ncbi:Csu type fimbrial protein [Ramlibacter humi]|uniref:Spore coat U domain-containing protein n=1 Tax=Ramlibacter humi TaxID=2530451 RepID=A0A4Z0CCI3_9BURK|nr:spore coat U domain-containing protein [Ramlibacter humi]TFZ08774.1 spore coat U domain-containing protein [Ramlibacter humi]